MGGPSRDRLGWWELAGEWMAIAGSLPHGRTAARLTEFLRDKGTRPDKGLQPVSLRKAVAARRFAEDVARRGLIDRADRLGRLPLERIEVLGRIARLGDEHVLPLLHQVAAGELDGDQLRERERRIRSIATGPPPDGANAHAYRLRGRSFRDRALTRLPGMFPETARYATHLAALSGCPAIGCDAVVATGTGYVGIRAMPIPSAGDAGRRRREALQLGLANGRIFEAYVFLFEHAGEAQEFATLLRSIGPCGVGVRVLDAAGAIAELLPPARSAPADLAVRFYGVFAALFPD